MSSAPYRARRLAGAALLVTLTCHLALDIGRDNLGELLWCCYVATALLGVSAIAGWRKGVAAGFVFHFGIGLPSYVVDVAMGSPTGTGGPLATVVHVAPAAIGLWIVLRTGLERRAWILAFALLVGTQALSLLTNPALDVNLVHRPWTPVALWFSSIWVYRVTNLGLALAFLVAADAIARWLVARNGREERAPQAPEVRA